MVTAVDQEAVYDNTAAAVDSTKSGICHTSTADSTGPTHTITKDLLNADPASEEED